MSCDVFYCVPCDISSQIPYPAKFWFSSYEPKCSQPVRLHHRILYNVTSQERSEGIDYLHADKHQRFLQVYTILFGGCGQAYSEGRQNNSFLILWQYFKKDLRDKSDFFA